MKKLLLLFTGLLFSMTTMATTDSLWVKGIVTNIVNGAPIPHHTVGIEIDSSTNWFFTYFKATDSSGRYASHIPLNGPTGYIKIFVWDCNNVRHSETRYYDINSVDTLYQDFQICDSLTPCHAYYSYAPIPPHLQEIQFTDQSTGNNIVSWQWVFSDPSSGSGNFSTLQNPTHYFSYPGYYNVCLTIHGADSLCYDTYCYNILVDSTSGNCHAAFTYYQDSLNSNYTYHFIDQSTGNITNWNWNFGDGQSSTVQNPVHTYSQPGIYDVQLYISNSDSTCHDNTFDTLVVGNGTGCQANFYYYTDSTNTSQLVHFFDISTGNPTHWTWNFDDPASGSNNTSTDQNPVHTYIYPGTYHVCLYISGNNCSDTICKNVVVPDSVSYHQIYGQVFASNFPLQLGFAMIFSMDTNQNSLPYVNVSTIDSNGVYYFTQVPDGNYVILGIPVNPAGYMPTYFGDVITWEQATVIVLGQPNNPYNIHLVAANSMNPGDGSASGQINSGKFAGTLIDKITMTLLDADLHPVGFSSVSVDGVFDFSGLAYGTYYLHPEMAGVTSDMVRIELTAAKPHVDVVMTFTGNRILGIGDILAVISEAILYPNPVTDQLTISINLKSSDKIHADVFTINGKMVFSTFENASSGESKIILPFTGLNDGMYIVKIHSEEGFNVVRRVVKSR